MTEPTATVPTPPHSLEAERAIVGTILVHPPSLDEVGTLRIDDLYHPGHRSILGALRAVSADGKPIDFLTVGDELARAGVRNAPDLVEIASDVRVTGPANIAHHVRIVREKATLRRLFALANELGARAMGGGENVEDLLADAQVLVNNLATRAVMRKPVKLADAVQQTVDDIERREQAAKAGVVIGVPTGIRGFDLMTGGLDAGWLVLGKADTKVGKSAYAGGVLRHAASRGFPVLAFTTEMRTVPYTRRLIAQQGSVNGARLTSGRLVADDWARIHGAAAALTKLPVCIEPERMRTSLACAVARQYRSEFPATQLGLIVVDYLQLIEHDSEDYEREEQAISASALAFKNLAVATGWPVLLLSQVTMVDGKAKARGSRGAEHHADLVLLIERKVDEQDQEENATGQAASLVVDMFRHGPTGSVPMWWQGEFTRFVNPSSDDDRTQEEMAFGA